MKNLCNSFTHVNEIYDITKQNAQWISVAREAYKAQQLRKEYDKIEKKLKEKLKALSDFENSCGGGFEFKKIVRQGSIAYKEIPELKHIDLELYRKDNTESWVLKKV